jgi:protease-4
MADIKVLLQAVSRPWFIEPSAALEYGDIVNTIFSREPGVLVADLLKPVASDFVFTAATDGRKMGPMNDPANAGSVAVINITGAVMKYDYCGAPGTQSIMDMIDQANTIPGVKGIVLQIDSPGGAVDGTQQLANKIKSSSKPVVAYVNGKMASAAMWFGSAASARIASANTDVIGSIGTMASWKDRSKMESAMGVTTHQVFATASTAKNMEMRATEGDVPDYQPLIDNILDPTNQEFIDSVKSNIPGVNEQVFTGAIYLAKDAMKMGLIDKIGSFNDAVKMVLKLADKKTTTMSAQTERFPKTLAVIGAESLEQLNEGVWLTEENVAAIESQLADADSNIETLTQSYNDLQANLNTANDTIEGLTQQLSDANSRIATMEKTPVLGAEVPAAENNNGTQQTAAEKYYTSVDAEAKKLRDMQRS